MVIKKTKSRCPVCHGECPAAVLKDGNDIVMERTCPTHGLSRFRIGDSRFYWLAQGDPSNSCCGESCCSADGSDKGTIGRNATAPSNTVERLATCTALIDIVDSCNLPCPACYAASPIGTEAALKYTPFEDVVRRVQGVIARKGKIELLQLSGGEPTLHPDFCKILVWAFDNPGIDHVLVNTNGVRIATDDAFFRDLKAVFRPKKMRLYLQYDGPQEAGQKKLRGADLRQMRIRTIERCAEIPISIHLAMTVSEENMAHLWDALLFGVQYPHVLGISYQPIFSSGRAPIDKLGQPITSGDVVIGLIDQSKGLMIAEDFTPLPCGDPNCQIVSGLARISGKLIPVVRMIDRANINKVLRNKIDFDVEALQKCGCEDQPLADFLTNQILLPKHGFFIFIKPFMDARTWDQDRIDRCCTHVIRPDGVLDSFCRYYSGFSEDSLRARRGVPLAVLG